MAKQESKEGNPSSEARLIVKARRIAASWSPELRGYVGLGVGIFLLLFSMGYFEFLKVIIGLLGFGLIVWGTIRTKLISKVTGWFDKLTDKF